MEIKKVNIDYNLLCREIEKAGKTKEGFSYELGRSKTFVCSIRKTPCQQENIEKLMCTLLGLKPGSLVKADKPRPVQGSEAKLLENIFKKLAEIQGAIEEQDAKLDTVCKKTNANTLQLERMKDMLMQSAETESDRAEKLLTELLSCGEALAKDIFAQADELCIARKEIMKAKKKLNVDVYTSGYGQQQKVIWRV